MKTHDPIARAFELAKSGVCKDVEEIHRKMVDEGYSNVASHLSGRSLKKQLNDLIKKAR